MTLLGITVLLSAWALGNCEPYAKDAMLIQLTHRPAVRIKQDAHFSPAPPPPGKDDVNHILHYLSLEEHPKATCNDGSPGAFWMKKAEVETSNWLVLLQGGGQCYSKKSCISRPPGNKGSASLKNMTWRNQTVFASPPFRYWNQVYVHYCSSDAWMGDVGLAELSEENIPWATDNNYTGGFRGRRIAEATLETLMIKHGLDMGDTLVFGGMSAGGRGAMVLIDELALRFPIKLGLLDSPYYIDFKPFGDIYGVVPVNSKGSTTCTAVGLKTIRTQAACKNAGKALGLDEEPQKPNDTANSPYGCYLENYRELFFNEDKDSEQKPSTPSIVPVCEKKDEKPLGPEFYLPQQTKEQVQLLRNQDFISKGCDIAANSEDVWMCAFGQFRIPQVQTKFIMLISLYDDYQLHTQLFTDLGFSEYGPLAEALPSVKQWANTFAAYTKGNISAAENMVYQNGIFAETCAHHATLASSTFWSTPCFGSDSPSFSSSVSQALAIIQDGNTEGMPHLLDHCTDAPACGMASCSR
eukprot:TRINITY_DN10109_c0_g1_i1.p1 TRINITY_DN10109_c0_g1~~TRINITY_DN10109_c0_g1_i1.p1  ORF type:complete len:524 (-),score=74.49 TRINITY_DN10109_c0_g1_i1:79-1650(-)